MVCNGCGGSSCGGAPCLNVNVVDAKYARCLPPCIQQCNNPIAKPTGCYNGGCKGPNSLNDDCPEATRCERQCPCKPTCNAGCCPHVTKVCPPQPCNDCGCSPCSSNCKTRTCTGTGTGSQRICGTFQLGVVSKIGARDEHRVVGTETVFSVDGYAKAQIHVEYGKSYAFTLTQAAGSEGKYEHMLFFTDDFLGGPAGYAAQPDTWGPSKLPNSPDSFGSGTVIVKIDSSWPSIFYYQDTNYPAVGGMIIAHQSRC